MTSVRRTASALLALPLLALVACAGEEPEPIMPTESASSTPKASEPSPTPEPWEAKTDAGAKAFVEHWFALFNDARLEGRTRPLADASTKDCRTCSNFVALANSFQAPGAFYAGKPWRLEQIASPTMLNQRASRVVVQVLQPPARSKSAADERPTLTKQSRRTMAATIHWHAGQWKMYELVFVA